MCPLGIVTLAAVVFSGFMLWDLRRRDRNGGHNP
jgi:hypothetical protein